MRLLELFSGTDSIGKEFPGEVVSLDITGSPTHRIDILQWDYTMYPPGHFDMIWASPPCTEYSTARVKANTPRDFIGADQLVQQAIQIIEYFSRLFGLLKTMGRNATPKIGCKHVAVTQEGLLLHVQCAIPKAYCNMDQQRH